MCLFRICLETHLWRAGWEDASQLPRRKLHWPGSPLSLGSPFTTVNQERGIT